MMTPTRAHSETPKPPDPVVGKWWWTDQQVVECLPDGSFTVTPTARKGRWKAVENKNESLKYEFTWDDGLFVDTLLMSRDRRQLTGKNKDKKKIAASKID
ncbi:MAG: hypothetical protein V4584_04120 [Verrucomicrobiota bacterium]